MKITTIVVGLRDGKVLLGMKKRGFGADRWNGFGGKKNEDETIEESLYRELLEETGTRPIDLLKRGVLQFDVEGEGTIFETHIYSFSNYSGDLRETEEMKPQWFDLKKIPYKKMFEADKQWFPLFLEGKSFTGHFYYTKDFRLVNHVLKEIADFDENMPGSSS